MREGMEGREARGTYTPQLWQDGCGVWREPSSMSEKPRPELRGKR